MTKAFISYSRRDTTFTRKLADALLAKEYELWVDWESIPPTVDWKQHIQTGVEESDVFLFLISPDSIQSRECAAERDLAIKNGKRLITLLIREINSADLPKDISHINWIAFDMEGKFEQAFKKLIEAINTDYEWVQTHSRLQVRALEWDRAARENSFLLRGKDLEFAERQVVLNSAKQPSPTPLQQEFILNSRNAAAKQRRTTTGVLIGVAIAMLLLAVAALFQRRIAVANAVLANANADRAQAAEALAKKNELIASSNAEEALKNADEAKKNALIAQVGEVSSLALGKLNQDYNESLLYSVESYKRAEKTGFNLERAKAALLTTIQNQPGLAQVLPAHGDWVNGILYSQDGKVMASASWDAISYLWDVSDPLNPTRRSQFSGDDIAISDDQTLFATSEYDENYKPVIKLWNIRDIAKPDQLGRFPGNYIVGFLKDGKTLVTQLQDQEEGTFFIELWNISNPSKPTLARRLDGMGGTLSHSGNMLAVFGTDAQNYDTITLWNLTNPLTPANLTTLRGNFEFYANDFELRQVAVFSPNDEILAISGYDTSGNAVAELWSITSPAAPSKLSSISGNADWINSLAFSPDGQQLAIGTNNGKIALWNVSDPRNPAWNPSSNTLTGHALAVNTMAFTPDGQVLATGSYDGNIMLWDMSAVINPLQVHAPQGKTVTFSSAGDRLVSTYFDEDSQEGATLVWDVSNVSNPIQLVKINQQVNEAVISADSQILVTSHVELGEGDVPIGGDVTLWDISDPSNPIDHSLLATDGYDLTLSPDHTVLLVTADDPQKQASITTLWDISDVDNPVQIGTVEDSLAVTRFSPDGKRLATADWSSGEITFWDISTPGKFSELGKLTGSSVTFSPDNKTIAIQVDEEDQTETQLWEMVSWAGRKQIATMKDSDNATFSPDGKLLATTINNDQEKTYLIELWDVAKPESPISEPLAGHIREITRLAFSPDGKILASASFDKAILLWDVSNPAQPQRGSVLNGHTDWIYVLTFNEDGTVLASGGDDHNVILWQVNAYNKAAQFGTLTGSIYKNIRTLQFVSNTRLISDSSTLWNIDPASWVDKACNLAGSNLTPDKWKQLFPDDTYEATCPNIIPESFTSVEGTIVPVTVDTNLLPACTEAEGAASGCPLLTIEQRSQFCVDKTSYTLYAVPEGSTLVALDANYKCNNEGVFSGDQLYSCYGPPTLSFKAQVCNAGCTVAQSAQCSDGFGLDPTGSCCMPVTPTDSAGCVEVSLQITDCKAIK